ncbi:hypothetical protein Barb6_02290 [Bacteroidales bacterium Barb6]|nr:hypothetical protein Barb6_02290 [Bacteroidales bacterium Barb6]
MYMVYWQTSGKDGFSILNMLCLPNKSFLYAFISN